MANVVTAEQLDSTVRIEDACNALRQGYGEIVQRILAQQAAGTLGDLGGGRVRLRARVVTAPRRLSLRYSSHRLRVPVAQVDLFAAEDWRSAEAVVHSALARVHVTSEAHARATGCTLRVELTLPRRLAWALDKGVAQGSDPRSVEEMLREPLITWE